MLARRARQDQRSEASKGFGPASISVHQSNQGPRREGRVGDSMPVRTGLNCVLTGGFTRSVTESLNR